MGRLTFTPRERAKMRGYCTGPEDGGPAPGEVGLDRKAPCCTCGRRVAITVRGRYSHHKPGPAVPWSACKVEFQIRGPEAFNPALINGASKPGGAGLPAGWSLAAVDVAVDCWMAVFRVAGAPTARDGRAVHAWLRRLGARPERL